jgi:hypothetical protein
MVKSMQWPVQNRSKKLKKDIQANRKEWEMEILRDNDEMHFISIELKIPVRDFYTKVLFS